MLQAIAKEDSEAQKLISTAVSPDSSSITEPIKAAPAPPAPLMPPIVSSFGTYPGDSNDIYYKDNGCSEDIDLFRGAARPLVKPFFSSNNSSISAPFGPALSSTKVH